MDMINQNLVPFIVVSIFSLILLGFSAPSELWALDDSNPLFCISKYGFNQVFKNSTVTSINQSNLLDNIKLNNSESNVIELYENNNTSLENPSLKQVNSHINTDHNCIKGQKTIDGKLMILHIDYDEAGQYKESYSIIPSDKDQIVPLYPTKNLDLQSGSNVSITGFMLNNSLFFDNRLDNSTSIIVQDNNDTAMPALEGNKRAAAILVNLGNENDLSFNNSVISNSLSQLNQYYSINSGNRFILDSDIFGPYRLNTIDESSPYCPFNSEITLKNYVDNVSSISDSDVYFPNYDYLILLAHYSGDYCDMPGLAWNSFDVDTIDTSNGKVSMDLSFIQLLPQSNSSSLLSVIGHEIGHNLGLGHANALECRQISLPESSINFQPRCIVYEESDPYDIMGQNNNYHLNAPHLETLDWLSTSNILTLTDIADTQRYTLKPIEMITDDLKILKIQRDIDDFLYIEFRQPITFNQTSGYHGDLFNGSLLHVSFPNRNSSASLLIDASPDNRTNFYLSILKPGITFIDPLSNVKIRVIAVNQNPNELVVEVGHN
ncbi:hypothetical protein [Candidatus Nitrosocosmicus arcticus]|uniref:Peptidase M11 gametolysin domain-containing protein n=1 Tax=Candidatus Nitrosocosmicus arcticus TaxID=2035267 RepID=A0A557STY0_9ARCH|nr:hypothetical protein [Candidatus Nitrosocosmicus arcticus]TVP40050.1 hypothetical protein NARC_100112 [Candidatus Nitrosocosmicus arcticus]